jgi:hypothetical protein
MFFSNKYEILTDTGWSDFHGIKRSKSQFMITITTSSGKMLECTPDHKIEFKYGFLEAKTAKIGDEIKTTSGYEEIAHVFHLEGSEVYAYDALQVSKGNKYFTNAIVSHNCQFLGSSGLLFLEINLKNWTTQNLYTNLTVYVNTKDRYLGAFML